MAQRRLPESSEILSTAISRRGIVRSLAAITAAGAAINLRVVPARAQSTPMATPIATDRVPGAVEEVTFALSGGARTHGQFDFPIAGAPPYPAVLLIQGSGPIDRYETFTEPDGTVRRPFDLITRELTGQGLAVFRFDKRGVCPPSQVCDPAAYAAQSKPVLIDDAALAYARMIANPLIDARHTAVLGHSEGTWLAPVLPGRFPEIQALVLISTGLGVMHALSFSQVTLPLLGVTPYDTDDDGALALDEVPLDDPIAMAHFQERIRVQGQLLLLHYEGSGQDLRPVGLNSRLDLNGDGKIHFLTELRPIYEAFFASIASPLAVIEQYADPAILPLAQAAFSEGFEAGMYASYQGEPLDQNLRTLLGLSSKPRILIVNGENDDQTPASSAQLLGEELAEAGFIVTTRIYPGLSHVLSPQADIFAPYGADMQAEPIAEVGEWLVAALNEQS
jgi:acetyl esterase/lipase